MKRRTMLAALSSFSVASCAGLLPQEELTFTGPLDPYRRPRTEAEMRRLAAFQQKEIRRSLHASMFQADTTAAFADFGYTPGSRMGYAVFRDGQALLLPNGRARLDLERIAQRTDSVLLAGAHGRTVVGFTPRGTLMSWDPDRTSRQLVLRPQQTTFGQKRVLDAVGLRDTNSLAVATEGGGIETWSLISGNRLSSAQLREFQPRRFAKGCRSNRVVFGTNSGEVRLWTGGRGSKRLYQHSGPVLHLQILPSGAVISSAKDGTAKLGSLSGGNAFTLATFSSAVYDIVVAPGGRHALIIPSEGMPRIVDIATKSAPRLLTLGLRQARAAVVFPSYGLAFTQHLSGHVLGWSLQNGAQLRAISLPARAEGMVGIIRRGEIIIHTADSEIYRYTVATRQLSTPLLRSQIPIVGVRTDQQGTQIMVALADNRLITFDNNPNQASPLEFGEA